MIDKMNRIWGCWLILSEYYNSIVIGIFFVGSPFAGRMPAVLFLTTKHTKYTKKTNLSRPFALIRVHSWLN